MEEFSSVLAFLAFLGIAILVLLAVFVVLVYDIAKELGSISSELALFNYSNSKTEQEDR